MRRCFASVATWRRRAEATEAFEEAWRRAVRCRYRWTLGRVVGGWRRLLRRTSGNLLLEQPEMLTGAGRPAASSSKVLFLLLPLAFPVDTATDVILICHQ